MIPSEEELGEEYAPCLACQKDEHGKCSEQGCDCGLYYHSPAAKLRYIEDRKKELENASK